MRVYRVFVAVIVCAVAATARTQTFQIVHSFSGSDGGWPTAPLIRGSDGMYYGTTGAGGANDLGTVFRMDPSGEVVTLHSFGGVDGAWPMAALLQAADGILYGTTSAGGAHGNGTVFRIDLAGNFTTLHSFDIDEGAPPLSALIQGDDGSFFGTGVGDGIHNFGTIFRVDSAGNLTVLHTFDFTVDGVDPSGLTRLSNGMFVGTTNAGGPNSGLGTIFQADVLGHVATLHPFGPQDDGAYPGSPLAEGADGALYGTTSEGGRFNCRLTNPPRNCGTIFQVDNTGAVVTLHDFTYDDGGFSQNALLSGADRNLYGTTTSGGAFDGGVIFRISPSGRFTLLHSFDSNNDIQGASPSALIQAPDGSFYGTAALGGPNGHGIVFRLFVGDVVVPKIGRTPAPIYGRP